jgi:phosphoglycolate phosphatase-like HAD superfamily hydrolase
MLALIKVFNMEDKRMKVKAILFDLDGTIFDITERDAFARYKALNELGYDVSLDQVLQSYQFGIGRLGPVKELGIKFTEKEEEEYIRASFAHFTTEEAAKLTKIHNGVHNVLSALSKGFQLIVVTSRDALSSTEEELRCFKIRKFLRLIVTREVAAEYHGVKKIPLLPFQEQRKKLYECAIGLTKIHPEDMLCVGDSVGELEPARKLGIKTIGVLTGFSSKEDMEKASISTIQNITYLVKILDCSKNVIS